MKTKTDYIPCEEHFKNYSIYKKHPDLFIPTDKVPINKIKITQKYFDFPNPVQEERVNYMINDFKAKNSKHFKPMRRLSAEDMLKYKETINRLEELGLSDINKSIEKYLAKTKNYKPDTYYHIVDGAIGESGVGPGLYLGRDKKVLKNFYDILDEDKKVLTFKGNPKWLDLMDYDLMNKFEKKAIKKYGKLTDNKQFRKYCMDLGYDGIRYYDPQATGEEFVLFNTNKITQI